MEFMCFDNCGRCDALAPNYDVFACGCPQPACKFVCYLSASRISFRHGYLFYHKLLHFSNTHFLPKWNVHLCLSPWSITYQFIRFSPSCLSLSVFSQRLNHRPSEWATFLAYLRFTIERELPRQYRSMELVVSWLGFFLLILRASTLLSSLRLYSLLLAFFSFFELRLSVICFVKCERVTC